IGYTMVYGIIGMINFAHGDIFMVGAFIALITFLVLVAIGITAVPLALLIVLIVAMALTALYGWTVERIAYRPLRHSFRPAPAPPAPPAAPHFRYRHIDRAAELRPGRPGCAGKAPAAADSRRLHAARGQRLRRAAFQHSSHRGRDHALPDGRVLPSGRPHAARPQHARLRAGPEDGGAPWHRRRSHHLAHLRHRRGARRGRRADVPALLRRRRFLHRLSRRGEGVHRGRARRHRVAARRDARRYPYRPDRDDVVGLFLDR